MNLIENAGFERDWGEESSHKVHVIPDEGEPYETEIGNIFTPPGGWVTWYRHGGEWAQPEAGDAWDTVDPVRVRSGRKGFKLFTFYRKHDAGLYQKVAVEAGSRVKLSGWPHAWSNGLEGEHLDDPRWSEGAGHEEVAWPGSSKPWDTGDEQEDAKPNFWFRIGIDPAGATDPLSDRVVWSDAYHIYNGYVMELSVEATAEQGHVTVFLRSTTLWAFKHNDAYWDDISLVVVEEPEPEPEPEPCPEILPGSDARVPYDRIGLLFNPTEDPFSMLEKLRHVWDMFRTSVFLSADDAGVGRGLNTKQVWATNPKEWPTSLGEFFATYYPDTELSYIRYENEAQLVGRVLAAGLRTWGVALVYPTTYEPAYVTSGFGEDRETYYHNGLDLRSSYRVWGNRILAATGGQVVRSGIYDDESYYGYQVRTVTPLANGYSLFVRYAHLVEDSMQVSVGELVEAGTLLGLPDNTGSSTGDHLHIDVRVTGGGIPPDVKLYADPEMLIAFPVIPDPEPDPEPILPPVYPEGATGLFGMHYIGGTPGYNEWVAMGPPFHKVIADWTNLCLTVKANPFTEGVARYWVSHQGQYIDHPDGPLAGATAFLQGFMGGLVYEMRKYGVTRVWVESVNEEYSHDHTTVLRALEFDLAFIEALKVWDDNNPDLDFRPVVFCAPVGNIQFPDEPGGEIWGQVLRLGAATMNAKGAFGYHGYHAGNTDDPNMYKRLGGSLQNRWMAFDSYLVSNGIEVYWMLGEVGSCKTWVVGNDIHFDPSTGWKGLYSILRYEDELLEVQRVWRRWNNQNGGRLLGGAIFQTGSTGWELFALESTNLQHVARTIASNW